MSSYGYPGYPTRIGVFSSDPAVSGVFLGGGIAVGDEANDNADAMRENVGRMAGKGDEREKSCQL